MHIFLEGVDGVEKTTIAKELAETLHFRFVEKPLKNAFLTNSLRICK